MYAIVQMNTFIIMFCCYEEEKKNLLNKSFIGFICLGYLKILLNPKFLLNICDALEFMITKQIYNCQIYHCYHKMKLCLVWI